MDFKMFLMIGICTVGMILPSIAIPDQSSQHPHQSSQQQHPQHSSQQQFVQHQFTQQDPQQQFTHQDIQQQPQHPQHPQPNPQHPQPNPQQLPQPNPQHPQPNPQQLPQPNPPASPQHNPHQNPQQSSQHNPNQSPQQSPKPNPPPIPAPRAIPIDGERCGYSINAKIDPKLAKAAKDIQNYLRSSKFRDSFTAYPASDYSTPIYDMYQCNKQLIPTVRQWIVETRPTNLNQLWIPNDVLEQQNNKATCYLERFQNQPLTIKYASLNIGVGSVILKLQMDDDSLKRIKDARRSLKAIYDYHDTYMDPINEHLQIVLAYAKGKMKQVTINELNQLNHLTRLFNGGKLMMPSIYGYVSLAQFRKTVDCRTFSWTQF